jgi:hypothetical protein
VIERDLDINRFKQADKARAMREIQVTVPELALLVGTRAALGAGLGLLLAGRLTGNVRRAVGLTLLIVGAVTTVPLAFELIGKVKTCNPVWRP